MRRHLDAGQVARTVDGAIIVLALIVALEAHPPAAGAMVASILGTAVAVGLAHAYSEALGEEIKLHHHLGREEYAEVAAGGIAIATGIAFPVVFFLAAAAGVMELDTAFDLAKWTGIGLVAFYGFCAARMAGTGAARALFRALVVATIALGLVLLKAVTH